MQFYSDPSKEPDPYSLPDAEVFQGKVEYFIDADPDSAGGERLCATEADCLAGFYYWFSFPGCLPDSDPFGPFETEQEAIDDCRETKWREYQQDRADEYRDEVNI